jgi:hypothetical protein
MSKGWECPVCHKGNAPFAAKCGHCEVKIGWKVIGSICPECSYLYGHAEYCSYSERFKNENR